MRFLLIVVVVFSFTRQLSCKQSFRWRDLLVATNKYVWPHRQPIAKVLHDVASNSDTGLSQQCSRALVGLSDAIKDNRQWGLQFLDSFAKMPSGFASGKYSDFGDFDLCLAADGPSSTGQESLFMGKYCLVTVNVPIEEEWFAKTRTFDGLGQWNEHVPLHPQALDSEGAVRIGICLPSLCDDGEISRSLGMFLKVNLTLDSACQTRATYKDDEPDAFVSFSRAALLSVIFLVALATILNYFEIKFLSHFDAIKNSRDLFSEQRPQKDRQRLGAINGFRIIILIFAHFFHTSFFGIIFTPSILGNMSRGLDFEVDKGVHWYLNEVFTNIQVNVCIQFVISGFLAYIVLYEVLEKMRGKVPIPVAILGRWLRTLPVLSGSILMILAFPMNFGSGPLYREGLTRMRNNCKLSWWREISGIGIFQKPIDSCILSGWVMNTDLQLFAIFIPVMILLYKKPALGKWLISALAVIGMLIAALIIYKLDLPPFADPHASFNTMRTMGPLLYYYPHVYFGSYGLGILAAFMVTSRKKFSNSQIYVIWTIVGICYQLVYLIPANWRPGNGSRAEQVVFGAIQMNLMSVAAAWFLYRMVAGDSFLSRVMSWRVCVPFGRMFITIFLGLTYAIFYDQLTERQPMELGFYPIVKRALATGVFGNILGYFMYLLFEAPFNLLLKDALKLGTKIGLQIQGKREGKEHFHSDVKYGKQG